MVGFLEEYNKKLYEVTGIMFIMGAALYIISSV